MGLSREIGLRFDERMNRRKEEATGTHENREFYLKVCLCNSRNHRLVWPVSVTSAESSALDNALW